MQLKSNEDSLIGSLMRVSGQELLNADDCDYLEQISEIKMAAEIFQELNGEEGVMEEGEDESQAHGLQSVSQQAEYSKRPLALWIQVYSPALTCSKANVSSSFFFNNALL